MSLTETHIQHAIVEGQALVSLSSIRDVLYHSMIALGRVTDATAGVLYLHGAEMKVDQRATFRSPEIVEVVRRPVEDASVIRVMMTGQPAHLQVAGNAQDIYPLRHGATLTGALRLTFPTQTVSQETITALHVLLGFVAAALANADSLQQVKQQVEDLEGAQQALHQQLNERLDKIRLMAMSELASAVAHQLNNPLTTIVADTEMLLSDFSEEAVGYRSLLAIQRAGKRAAEVAHRLMSVSQRGEDTPVRTPVNIQDTVEDVLYVLQSYLDMENVTVVKQFDDNLPQVYVAPDVIGDVWFNLLMNARDELRQQDGGTVGIDVAYHPDREQIAVSIWDSGRGITAAEQDRVFEPFYTTRSTAERTGLGLHICKQIIQGLQGEMSVSQQPGGGARFTVYLPVQKG